MKSCNSNIARRHFPTLLQDDTLFIAHHDAVEALEEIAHYDKKSLPNGAISYMRVVDRKGVSAC